MGFRGLIRDFLGIYLGYEIIKGYVYQNFSLTATVLIAAVILLILSVWFLLERIGLLPKLTA